MHGLSYSGNCELLLCELASVIKETFRLGACDPRRVPGAKRQPPSLEPRHDAGRWKRSPLFDKTFFDRQIGTVVKFANHIWLADGRSGFGEVVFWPLHRKRYSTRSMRRRSGGLHRQDLLDINNPVPDYARGDFLVRRSMASRYRKLSPPTFQPPRWSRPSTCARRRFGNWTRLCSTVVDWSRSTAGATRMPNAGSPRLLRT